MSKITIVTGSTPPSIGNATPPVVLVVGRQSQNSLTSSEIAAIKTANAPGPNNAFVTEEDLTAATAGFVVSVNGELPDEAGNIELPIPTSADSPEYADILITSLSADSFFVNTAKSVLSWITKFTDWLKAALTDAGRDTGFLGQAQPASIPTATSFRLGAGNTFYQKGKKAALVADADVEVSNPNGISYIGMAAGAGALVSSELVWTLEDFLAGYCSVAITHGYNNHLIGFEERHNYGRDIRRHMNDHLGRGAFINPAGFLRTAPSAASPGTIDISSGSQFDEDLHVQHGQALTCRRWWRAPGGASLQRDTVTSADMRVMNGNLIRWDNNGTLTNGSPGNYYPYFVYAASEKWASSGNTTGLYVVMAQGEYPNAAAAKAAPRPTLPGFPTNELVLLYVVPFKQANVNSVTLANADIVDWRASQLGGSASTGTFSAVASAIALAPVAGLTSDDVQELAEELQVTKSPIRIPYSKAGALAVATGTLPGEIVDNLTLSSGTARVGVAPTGADITGNIRKNEATTIGTFLIDAGSKTGVVTITDGNVSVGDYLTVDITGVGSTIAGSDLTLKIPAILRGV